MPPGHVTGGGIITCGNHAFGHAGHVALCAFNCVITTTDIESCVVHRVGILSIVMRAAQSIYRVHVRKLCRSETSGPVLCHSPSAGMQLPPRLRQTGRHDKVLRNHQSLLYKLNI